MQGFAAEDALKIASLGSEKKIKNFDLHDESCATIQGFADCSEVNSKMSRKAVFEWCL
jgi:hypothetical protein